MTDATTQLKIGASLDGSFETTTNTAKRKIGDIGAAARDAGKSTGSIGDGMDSAAKKVETSTKAMIRDIQRQTAAMEAGGKASRQYQEALARQRGIDVGALKPYLDQLDSMKAKQEEATRSAESFAASMSTVKMAALAAGAAAGAMVLFAKSIIDTADGLNDLSQQVGISVKELGKYQLAAEQSGTSLEAIARGVKGLAKNIVENGDALRKAGIDATNADGALQQLADVFNDMPDGVEKTTLAVKLFGKSGMDLIPMLNLGSEGMRDAAMASAEYAEQMSIMAPLADQLNDQMAEIALASKTAGAAMVNEFLPSLNQIAAAFVSSKDSANGFATVIGSVVNTVVQTAALLISDVVFVLNGVGIEIGGIAAQAGALARLDFKGFTAISDAMKEDAVRARKEHDQWQSDLVNGVKKANTAVQAEYNKRQGFGENSTGSTLLGLLGGSGGKGDADAKKALAEANKELEKRAAILAELSGYTKDYEETQQRYAAMLKSGAIEQETYNRAVIALVAKQPGMVALTKEQTEAQKLLDKAYADTVKLLDAYNKDQQKAIASAEDEVTKAQESYDAHGKLASVIQQEVLARLENNRAIMAGANEDLSTIDAQIAAKKELIAILRKGEIRNAAEDLAKDNKKAAEESSKYWEDALMRAFESGKGFFESLWDTIKNTLKTQVLKVLVTGTMTGLAGAANATLGSSAGSAVGSLLGGAATSAGTGTLTSLLGSSSMGSLDIAGFAVGGPAGIAVAAAAAALYAIFGNRKTPSAGTGEGNMSFDASGNVTGSTSRYSGSWGLTSEVEKTLQNLSTSYLAAAKSLGIGAVAAEFGYGGNTGKEGKDPQFALGVNAGGVGYSSGEIKLTDENVQLAASRAILAALQGSEVPTYLEGVFDDLTASTATQDQITAVLNNAKAYKDFHTALSAMPWDNLTNMSYKAAKGLAEASGGLETLGNNLAGFYQNFYSDAEQTANLTRFLGDNFTALGLSMPTDKLREWYRGQVEAALALDQSIPANAAYTAGLLSMQSGVNNLADSAETAAQRIIDAAAKLEAEIVSAQDSAMQEYMSAQAEYNSLIAAEQESAAQAMQAAAEAIESAMASAGQGIVAFIDSLLNTPTNAQSNYQRDLALAQQGDVEASKRLPTSGRAYLDTQINSSATAYEAARATAKMVQELNALPAVKSYEQQLLEAVGGTTKAVQDLNGKLITELTVTARSEITKLINFVANTDELPDDLKQLALGATSTFTKTVEYVLGSVLSPDMQALALEQNSTLTKTVRLALGDDLPDETKRIVLMASESVSKTIGLVAFSTMTADQQAMVLQTTGSITKTISLAAGALDQVALGVAFAQSGTIERIVRASGGELTPEQQQLLSAVDVYNKTVNIDVKLDATELTAFQTMLKEIFGTISIPGITGDGLGGVDLTDIVGQAYLDRLESINTYINSLDWSLENSKASAWATYYAAQQYGVSQADIANATGLNYSDIQALFDSANVPRFAMGTNYLPRDMLAQVHQGERIIPAADNRELMNRLQDPQQNSVALVAEIKALRDDNAAQARAMVQLQQRLTKLMERWDSNGLPSERLET